MEKLSEVVVTETGVKVNETEYTVPGLLPIAIAEIQYLIDRASSVLLIVRKRRETIEQGGGDISTGVVGLERLYDLQQEATAGLIDEMHKVFVKFEPKIDVLGLGVQERGRIVESALLAMQNLGKKLKDNGK